MERATCTSTEFGRLRIDIEKGEVFVEETSLDKRLPVKKTANGKLHQERSGQRQAFK